jgi:hypothetical protein
VEISATALGDVDAPRVAGVVEPLTVDFGRTAHSAVLPAELRVRLPSLPQDACSATTMSESGDSQPSASASGGSTPARNAMSSHSLTAPLLRSVGTSGSGNILAVAARSVSQGNLSGYSSGRGLQPAVRLSDSFSGLLPFDGSVLADSQQHCVCSAVVTCTLAVVRHHRLRSASCLCPDCTLSSPP